MFVLRTLGWQLETCSISELAYALITQYESFYIGQSLTLQLIKNMIGDFVMFALLLTDCLPGNYTEIALAVAVAVFDMCRVGQQRANFVRYVQESLDVAWVGEVSNRIELTCTGTR